MLQVVRNVDHRLVCGLDLHQSASTEPQRTIGLVRINARADTVTIVVVVDSVREANMYAVKYLLIAFLLLAGSMFFYAGLGFNIPEVEFGNVAAYGVPLALALFVASALISQYWEGRHCGQSSGEGGTSPSPARLWARCPP